MTSDEKNEHNQKDPIDTRTRTGRLPFACDCRVEMTDPPWAITPEPLDGTTINLTQHGMKIRIKDIGKKIASNWLKAIEKDMRLRVRVKLMGSALLPPLSGDVVWVNYDVEEDICTIGVILGMISDETIELLRNFIEALDRQSEKS